MPFSACGSSEPRTDPFPPWSRRSPRAGLVWLVLMAYRYAGGRVLHGTASRRGSGRSRSDGIRLALPDVMSPLDAALLVGPRPHFSSCQRPAARSQWAGGMDGVDRRRAGVLAVAGKPAPTYDVCDAGRAVLTSGRASAIEHSGGSFPRAWAVRCDRAVASARGAGRHIWVIDTEISTVVRIKVGISLSFPSDSCLYPCVEVARAHRQHRKGVAVLSLWSVR